MSKKLETSEISEETVDLGRRSALSRLGLAATAAYAAPVLITLSQSAHAKGDDDGGGDDSGHGGGDDSGHGGGDDSGSGGSTSGSGGSTSGSEGSTSGSEGSTSGSEGPTSGSNGPSDGSTDPFLSDGEEGESTTG